MRKLWFYPRVHIGKAVHKASYCNIKPTGHMRPRAPKSGYLKSQSSVATTTRSLSLAAASPGATLQAPNVAPSTHSRARQNQRRRRRKASTLNVTPSAKPPPSMWRRQQSTQRGAVSKAPRKPKNPAKLTQCEDFSGGSDRRRSGDLSIFSRTLYQLSYRANLKTLA